MPTETTTTTLRPLYTPLTDVEKSDDPPRVPSGIFKSGELNFLDPTQVEPLRVFSPSVFGSIAAQSGLIFPNNPYLSNGLASLNNSITDFTIFNPYIHHVLKVTPNTPTPTSDGFNLNSPTQDFAYRVQYGGQYSIASQRFNIYSQTFRNLQ